MSAGLPPLPRRTARGALGAGEPDDQVQRHVDAGADAGAGDHVAVVDEPVVRP